jgi:hypothetical protein
MLAMSSLNESKSSQAKKSFLWFVVIKIVISIGILITFVILDITIIIGK